MSENNTIGTTGAATGASTRVNNPPASPTRSGILQGILMGYLDALPDPLSSKDIMDPATIQPIIDGYIGSAKLTLQLRNAGEMHGAKMKLPFELPNFAVAEFIARTHETALVTSAVDPDGMLVTKEYDVNGEFTGIWTPSFAKQESCPVTQQIYALRNYEAKRSEVSDIFSSLKNKCASSPDPRDHRSEGYPNQLIPFYNGVYDGRDHTFTEYNDPDYEVRHEVA